jgi:hypothetical protein
MLLIINYERTLWFIKMHVALDILLSLLVWALFHI